MNIYGKDIKLNENMELIVSANGDVALIDNIDTLFQDIKLRILTSFGTLFYEENYGSNFSDFIFSDVVDNNSISSEVIRTIEQDPRIEPYSIKVSVIENSLGTIKAEVTYKLINEDTNINQTIDINKSMWSINNEI